MSSPESRVGAGEVAGVVVAAIAALGFAALGIVAIKSGADLISIAYGRPRPEVRCDARRLADCVEVSRGVVSFDTPAAGDLAVSYDDGTKTVALSLAGDRVPEAGTRVELESWRGRFVSLYDPAAQRRYRTSHWPARGSDLGDGVVEILLGAGFVAVFVFSVISAAPSLRRRATRSSADG